MARSLLGPGFRFRPTDVELVRYYLRRKVMHKPFFVEAISEVELYKFSPWDLPDKSCLQSRDLEWYFFCPRDRKYTNSSRANRATDIGYWKTTGKDRFITYNSRTIGMKRTLVFHEGRATHGARTNWVMHEYRLEDEELVDAGYSQDSYVLCKIFKKSGPGPKNGEQYGAPFKDVDWDDEVVDASSVSFPCLTSAVPEPTDSVDALLQNSLVGCEGQCGPLLEPSDPQLSENPGLGPLGDEDLIDVTELLKDLSEDDVILYGFSKESDVLDLPGSSIAASDFNASDASAIYYGLEDLSRRCDSLANMYPLDCMENETSLLKVTGASSGCFLEMIDLEIPSEGRVSGHGIPDQPYGYHVNTESMSGFGIPNFSFGSMVTPLPETNDNYSLLLEGNNIFASDFSPIPEIHTSGMNLNNEYQVATQDLNALQASEDTEYMFALASIPEGELQSNTSANLENVTSNRISSYSRLQLLLDSIPARPASAAECPFPFKGGGKADVNLRCVRINDGPVDRSGGCPCMCCCSGSPVKRRGRGPSPSGRGFMYVFLLGMVTAFIWFFFVALVAKLGGYAWSLLVL